MDLQGRLAARRNALTPEQLAVLQARLRGTAPADATGGEIPRLGTDVAPLSFAQRRLWFLTQLEPESPFYNLACLARLRGKLDRAALAASLETLTARHESLRTVFRFEAGDALQQVLPTQTPELRTVGPAADVDLADLIEQETQRLFDLANGPLWRASLVDLGEEDAVPQHLLILALHHIIADGWSLEVLLREIIACYSAHHAGAAPALPPLPVQYGDYAAWQHSETQAAAMEQAADFWKRTLAGLAPLLPLPTDRPRPAQQSYRGAVHRIRLPEPLVGGLRALSGVEGATLFETLLATFQVLLLRYTGVADIPVGVPVANRERPELEGLIGFFVNTLVMRGDLRGNPSFVELLRRVRETARAAQSHQALPFERLVELLRPERDPSHHPVFQVMFSLQRLPARVWSLPDMQVEVLEPDSHSAKFDLSLLCLEQDDEIIALFEYCADLFESESIAAMANDYLLLLQAVVDRPDTPIGLLPLAAPVGGPTALVHRPECAEEPPVSLLHQWVERQSAASPQAPAVRHGAEILRYDELNRRADRLARHLVQQGVNPEARVLLCLERGVDAVVGMLAILKAGGAYVPVDPGHPAERISDIAADSGAKVVVSTRRHQARLPDRLVFCDADEIPVTVPDSPLPRIHPDQVAYLIYTSGSTGRPKGVLVSHRNAVRSTWARHRCYPEPVGGFLLLSPLGFDSSVAGLFWTLSQGGVLRFPDEDGVPDVEYLAQLIQTDRLTHLLCVPALYALLLEPLSRMPEQHLRVAIVAGESCPPELPARHRALLPQAALYNEYGPTECTVWSTMQCLSEAHRTGPVSIGLPLPGVSAHVLDAHLQPAPCNVAGELYLGGAQLARGYQGRPDLTAERFVPDPFAETPGGRLYRTGDLVRRNRRGELEFLGRTDQQIKIRGHRVEPGEIETCLCALAGVKEAAVIAREDTPGVVRLVAYLGGSAGLPDEAALRTHVAARLPGYMQPAAYVRLERLPRNANGKLDRQALPAPPPPAGEAWEAPRTALEETLCRIWAEVLGLERMGIHDDFFQLGGHSLSAVRLIMSLQKQLDREIPLAVLFARPKVSALAEWLQEGESYAPVGLSLEREAELESFIVPISSQKRPNGEKRALLTGATGFLGAYLLRELLRQTDVTVHCLVRAADSGEAYRRVRDVMNTYGLWQEEWKTRLIGEPGDLSQPMLGLSQQHFDQLAETVDVIYHNGALVNFALPYAALKGANVTGTRDVIRLACFRCIPIHHVSTLSVFGKAMPDGAMGFTEDQCPPASAVQDDSGYAQSKWVAEQLMLAAARRGLPVTVYRPGFVIGDSHRGAWNADDFLGRILRACMTLGLAPDRDDVLDLAPVDYVASALVWLSQHAVHRSEYFHLRNANLVHLPDLFDWTEARGYSLKRIPYHAWLSAVQEAVERNPDFPLAPLLTTLFEENDHNGTPWFDDSKARAALEDNGLVCPEISRTIWHRYLDFLVRDGWLPDPDPCIEPRYET